MSTFYKTKEGDILEVSQDIFSDVSDLEDSCGIKLADNFDDMYDKLPSDCNDKIDNRVKEAIKEKYNFIQDPERGNCYSVYDKETDELLEDTREKDLDEAAIYFQYYGLNWDSDKGNVIDELNINTDDLFIYSEINSYNGSVYAFMDPQNINFYFGKNIEEMTPEEIEDLKYSISDTATLFMDGNVWEVKAYDPNNLDEEYDATGFILADSERDAAEAVAGDVEGLGEYDNIYECVEDNEISLNDKIKAASEKASSVNEGKETKSHDDLEL